MKLESSAPDQAREKIVVSLGELAVSNDPSAVIVSYALGSCVAVILYDPIRRFGGLLHYMLPKSDVSKVKAKAMPAMFADTGVPELFHRMYALGSAKGDLIVKVAGGGSPLTTSALDIGRANVEVLQPMFARAGVRVSAWDVGGTASRTVELTLATGQTTVRSKGREWSLG